MENYLNEQGLATYDTLIKSYISRVMTSRSEIPQSLMAVINDIDSHVDTMFSNYVTKTDLQNALANIGGGEVITIHTTNASGNAHVECKSGDTVINANLVDGDTVTIPFGAEYSLITYDSNNTLILEYTVIATKMSSSFTADLTDISIDLNLPSGKLWATKNIGAASPKDDGLYFTWGNTNGYVSTSGHYFGSSYYEAPGKNLGNSFTSGDPTYDAARANMGGNWRVPTLNEYQELIDNCTWTWGTVNNVSGYTVTGSNGNSIFLPAVGHFIDSSKSDGFTGRYWSATYYNSSNARYLYFDSASKTITEEYRYWGLPIRAVRSPQS